MLWRIAAFGFIHPTATFGLHPVGVAYPPRDDGVVRVAVQKIYDDFLLDARDVRDAVVGFGPALADADPARAVFVVLPAATPVELDFDAGVLVGPDFFAGRADDGDRLRAGATRLDGMRL